MNPSYLPMNLKNYSLCLFFLALLFSGTAVVNAVQLASAKVLYVNGDVTYSASDTEEMPLAEGMILTEGHGITTYDMSSVYLIFSNGSELSLEENSNLVLAKLEQAPFEGSDSDSYPQADPSKSTSILKLNHGSIKGHVKQLRSVSEFKVETRFGTASILGTRFIVEMYYDKTSNELVFNIQNIDGRVDLTSSFFGLLKFGRYSAVNVAYSADSKAVQTVSIPPTRTVSVRKSAEAPELKGLVQQFPEVFESKIVLDISPLQPLVVDQVVSPNGS